MPIAQHIRSNPRPFCFLCGTEGHVLYRELQDPFFGASGKWSLKTCANTRCGMLWLDPSPCPEDLHLAYREYFTHEDGHDQQLTLRGALLRVYQLAAGVPATLSGLAAEKKGLERMFIPTGLGGRLLDVGCGEGAFLNQMRKVGWEVDGVDFDCRAIETAKKKYGLALRTGDLKGVGFESNSFDAITLSHVIEHVPDPLALLHEVHRLLKVRGKLVVTTPNSSSLGHQTFKAHWFGIDAPRHLQVFNVTALAELGRRAGFEQMSTSTSAARADIFMGASARIKTACGARAQLLPPPSILRTMKAVDLQYREHFSLKKHPDWGEEAVLEAYKS